MYYFVPPAGLLIDGLNDWVAFATFTVTAIVVGELAARAERRQIEAQEGRREIEQLYQQLRSAFDRASEAEAARRNEQLKAALLDALTHNLRTPLTAIKASVTAILGSDATVSSPHLSREGQHDLLQVIDEESDRLNRFIEGLSVADRPDPTQSTSSRRAAVNAIIREALTRAGTVLRRHRVQLACDDGSAVAGRGSRGHRRSRLHPARQREQVFAGRHDDSRLRVIGRSASHPGRRGR